MIPRTTRIEELRRMRGLTQSKLAELSGVAQSTISQYESGERHPRFDICQQLADVLGVTPYDVIGRSIDPGNPPYAELEIHCESLSDVSACMNEYSALCGEHVSTIFGPVKIIVDHYHSST